MIVLTQNNKNKSSYERDIMTKYVQRQQYIVTYTRTYVCMYINVQVKYACSLPSLANINSLFFFNFQKDFYSSCKFRTGEMVLMSNPKIGGGDLMLLPLYQHMYIQALQGVLVNVITALNTAVCVIWFLFSTCFHHPPHPIPTLPTYPNIYVG